MKLVDEADDQNAIVSDILHMKLVYETEDRNVKLRQTIDET